MNIDWIIALGLFLVVTAWSFTFYIGFFNAGAEPLGDVLDSISDKFIGYLTTDTYVMHANYTESLIGRERTFYVDMDFPEGTNLTTKIYVDGTLISDTKECEIQLNQILFNTTVTKFASYQFVIKFQNTSDTYCDGALNTETKLKPSVKEKKRLVTQAKIDNMDAMPIEHIKANLSINRDFRVEIETNNIITNTFGVLPPNSTNVYVKEVYSRIFDTDNRVLIRTMVW
ncbi:MAG: hypothetical protein ABIH55_00845 [Nanoarchaeota archaeon]|nr:hypothetical protein [Nanoarchaeota archaeon]MBU1135064.1 hypothetical protein [Nanoarchaeota archaeon]